MRFAYADPPYPGYAGYYPEQTEVDQPRLIHQLVHEYPDGWALSTKSSALRELLPLCPDDVRVLAWVKPYTPFRAGVTVAYAWEPVLVRGGRKRPRTEDTVRDWHLESASLNGRILIGAKPPGFCHWVLDVLYALPGDEIVDLFPGTGAFTRAMTARLDPPRQLLLAMS
ncbi:MAG TPA: hypothetical protein VKV41_25340 [Methylomirabilota bacterium]|nr:hypothetical protein [Methylomirabilota bacterium]